MRRKLFLIALLFVPLESVDAFADFSGRVVGISGGDTIKVMHNGKAEKIRLHGIDCPEKAQPFGTKAKQFTSERAFGKTVTVHVTDTDRYGRTVPAGWPDPQPRTRYHWPGVVVIASIRGIRAWGN